MLNDIKKTLWATADELRANMDAAEYKHLVLGLIFIKYISDTFAAHRDELTRRYARARLPDGKLGELVDLVSTIGFGDDANTARDVLGQVYDPCCGSGGIFVQSEKFIEAHGGTIGDVSIYGQESNPTTWRLAARNLAIRGIDFNLGREPGDILADLAFLNPELWTTKEHPETVLYIDLANAKNDEITTVSEIAFDEAPSRARRVLRSGDTIVGTVRPGSRSFAFIHNAPLNLTGSTGFAVFRLLVKENTEFVYLSATRDASIEHLTHIADGEAYPAVRPDVVAGLIVAIPTSEILSAFHQIAATLLIAVAENLKQAQTLAVLRDTLLPRLISGKLRRPEVESLITELAS